MIWLLVIYLSSEAGFQTFEFTQKESCEEFRQELIKMKSWVKTYSACIGKKP